MDGQLNSAHIWSKHVKYILFNFCDGEVIHFFLKQAKGGGNTSQWLQFQKARHVAKTLTKLHVLCYLYITGVFWLQVDVKHPSHPVKRDENGSPNQFCWVWNTPGTVYVQCMLRAEAKGLVNGQDYDRSVEVNVMQPIVKPQQTRKHDQQKLKWCSIHAWIVILNSEANTLIPSDSVRRRRKTFNAETVA